MAKIFRFLKDEELQHLVRTADRKRYEPEDVLIEEGAEQSGILIVLKGRVSVKRDHVGFAIEIGSLGPGEIFGEMSFIEGLPASASVVAVEPTDAAIISHGQLKTIIAENPGFYGRFYHSLADILSRRLRETSDMVLDSA